MKKNWQLLFINLWIQKLLIHFQKKAKEKFDLNYKVEISFKKVL